MGVVFDLDMVDAAFDNKGIVIIDNAFEVSYVRDSETVKEIEGELVFEDFWEDGLDTRSQARALLESFQSRELFGWEMIEGQETAHSVEGPFRTVLESLSEFPEFFDMLMGTPGQYCTPIVHDSKGIARFWAGMYRPLED
mgnify:CR=1 FL=1